MFSFSTVAENDVTALDRPMLTIRTSGAICSKALCAADEHACASEGVSQPDIVRLVDMPVPPSAWPAEQRPSSTHTCWTAQERPAFAFCCGFTDDRRHSGVPEQGFCGAVKCPTRSGRACTLPTFRHSLPRSMCTLFCTVCKAGALQSASEHSAVRCGGASAS